MAHKLSITDAELQALHAWRDENGRRWKGDLLQAWESQNYGWFAPMLVSVLQGLRNTHGPSWLKTLKL